MTAQDTPLSEEIIGSFLSGISTLDALGMTDMRGAASLIVKFGPAASAYGVWGSVVDDNKLTFGEAVGLGAGSLSGVGATFFVGAAGTLTGIGAPVAIPTAIAGGGFVGYRVSVAVEALLEGTEFGDTVIFDASQDYLSYPDFPITERIESGEGTAWDGTNFTAVRIQVERNGLNSSLNVFSNLVQVNIQDARSPYWTAPVLSKLNEAPLVPDLPPGSIAIRISDGTVIIVDDPATAKPSIPKILRDGIDLGDGSGGGGVPSSAESAVDAGFGSADKGEFGTGTYQDPFPVDASDGGTAGGGTAGAGGQTDGAGDDDGPTSAQSASDAGFGDPWAGEFGGSPGAEPVPPPRVVAVDPSGLYRPVDGDSVPTSYIVTLSDGTRLDVSAAEIGTWEAALNGGGGERTWTDTDGVTYTRFADGSVLAVQPDDSDAWVPPQLHLPATGGGNNGGKPLLIDLDGDGLEILGLTDDAAVDAANADLARLVGRSRALYDLDGDGMVEPTAWLAPDDGLIAYDADGDGRIAGRAELVLADWADDRFATDLDGLAAFDSDGDGRFTPADAEWGAFRLWQDRDGDGTSDTGELPTEAGPAGRHNVCGLGSPRTRQRQRQRRPVHGARRERCRGASGAFSPPATMALMDRPVGSTPLGVSELLFLLADRH